jgi:polyhydroxyalkanoate synthesis regulator phasin
MAAAGRPPKKLGHIDGLEGPARDKQRLRVILDTITGEKTVLQACEELAVSEARLHELRRQVLQGALTSLAPGRPGRPKKETPAEPDRVQELERQISELELELKFSQTREEIAMTMPHVLVGKKNEPQAKARRRKRKKRRR